MSISTSVYGIIPPDDNWKKMKAVWDACNKAGISPPSECNDFFNGEEPDESGVIIELKARKSSPEMENRFEIDLASLPPHVKTIRFVISY